MRRESSKGSRRVLPKVGVTSRTYGLKEVDMMGCYDYKKESSKGYASSIEVLGGRFLSDDYFLITTDMKGASFWVNK